MSLTLICVPSMLKLSGVSSPFVMALAGGEKFIRGMELSGTPASPEEMSVLVQESTDAAAMTTATALRRIRDPPHLYFFSVFPAICFILLLQFDEFMLNITRELRYSAPLLIPGECLTMPSVNVSVYV